MLNLKSLWINFGIYSGTIIWTLLAIALSPVAYVVFKSISGLDKATAVRRLVWFYGRVWVSWVSLFVPIERESQKPPSPCILVANHASFFDTYLVGAQPAMNICLTIRDWPYKIPFYKPFMLAAEYVNTESNDMDQVIEQSMQALDSGSTMVYFPEGTRTHSGQLGRFKSGAFYTAIKAGVPIVPMCISGSYELLPRGKKILQYSPIKVSLLPAVYPAKYQHSANGHVQMRKDVRAMMAHALEKNG